MTRNGKIARLPHSLREQLNTRLRNGEKYKRLLAWLNSLPEVRTLLAAEFARQPISQQNLTRWRLGGFDDWQTRQLALELPPNLAGPPTDKLARWLTLRYAAAARALTAPTDKPETSLRRLRHFAHVVSTLRRDDLAAQFLRLEQQCLLFRQAKLRQSKELKNQPTQFKPIQTNTRRNTPIQTEKPKNPGPNGPALDPPTSGNS